MAELDTAEELNDFVLVNIGESIDVERYDDTTINDKNTSGWTLLMYACNRGLQAVVSQLIAKGANPSIRNNDDATALMIAAAAGDLAIVENVIDKGNLELADNRGWTALFYAVFYGRELCIDYLLRNGANTQVVDHSQQTPIQLALKYGMDRIAKMLLKEDIMNTNRDKSPAMRTPGKGTSRFDFLKSRRTFTPNNNNNNLYCKNDDNNFQMTTNRQISVVDKDNISPGRMKSHSRSPRLNQASVTPIRIPPHTPPLMKAPPTPTSLPRQVAKTSTPTVLEFLTQLQLEKYWPIFRDEEVDFETFITFDSENLKEIGISLYGPRRKISLAIEEYRTFHGKNSNILKNSSWCS